MPQRLRILLHTLDMCLATIYTICVLILLCMCPHTTMYCMCRQVLRPFMTRRLKADLKDIMELPETREATIWCVFVRACVRACVCDRARARARALSAPHTSSRNTYTMCPHTTMYTTHIDADMLYIYTGASSLRSRRSCICRQSTTC